MNIKAKVGDRVAVCFGTNAWYLGTVYSVSRANKSGGASAKVEFDDGDKGVYPVEIDGNVMRIVDKNIESPKKFTTRAIQGLQEATAERWLSSLSDKIARLEKAIKRGK